MVNLTRFYFSVTFFMIFQITRSVLLLTSEVKKDIFHNEKMV